MAAERSRPIAPRPGRQQGGIVGNALTAAVVLCGLGLGVYVRSLAEQTGSLRLVRAPNAELSMTAEAPQRLEPPQAVALAAPQANASSASPGFADLGSSADTDREEPVWSRFIAKEGASGLREAMWNWMGPSQEAYCRWQTFKPRWSEKTAEICLYGRKEYVSRVVRRMGHWPDCDALVPLWREHARPGNIYLEFGANIGACVLEMLLSTDAPIVAFEPEPNNFAHLTSTLAELELRVRRRVALFPFALGAAPATLSLFQAATNRGNSVINVSVQDFSTQSMLPPITVRVEALDLVVSPPAGATGGGRVALVKMDVQGFECNGMDGGRGVFSSARVVRLEVARQHLEMQGCSATALALRLTQAGLRFTLPPEPLPAVLDLTALRPAEGAAQAPP